MRQCGRATRGSHRDRRLPRSPSQNSITRPMRSRTANMR
ncbi:hypothetical protein E2C01_077864 [Portunus trituberculatus]|uniref:Uncharacterized protein n=1 Tax=Portunus trituberculatus TaxID=210409 RepID=A0A5B7IR20_PORTR|nr:hypothetical protein [Portunus trituberculatus]